MSCMKYTNYNFSASDKLLLLMTCLGTLNKSRAEEVPAIRMKNLYKK